MANNFKRILISTIAFITVALPLLTRQALAATATMYLSPASGSFANGSISSIGVYENSGSDPVNAASFVLTYPSDKFDFISTVSSSSFNVVASNSGGGGTVHVDRGASSPVSGTKLIATVKLKAKVSTGSATITINPGAKVVSANSHTNILSAASSGSYSFKAAATPATVPADTTPPTISSINSSDIVSAGATISWITSEASNSEVDYGLNSSYGLTAVSADMVTSHKIVLSSEFIQPGMKYHFRVVSTDIAGNKTTSTDQSFTVKGLSLSVRVTNSKNQAVSGAKVTIDGQSGTTNKKGEVILNGLTIGKKTGTIMYKGQTTAISADIKSSHDANPQSAIYKIKASSGLNLLFVLLIPLAAAIAILVDLMVHISGRHLWPAVMGKLPAKSNVSSPVSPAGSGGTIITPANPGQNKNPPGGSTPPG